jgi:hypothetical protein
MSQDRKTDIEFTHWQEAVSDELPLAERERFLEEIQESEWSSGNPDAVHARMIVWQFENKPYGLKHLRSVKGDKVLLGFCEELIALRKREQNKEDVSEPLKDLGERASKAWVVIGEKRGRENMAFARQWAWLGARKWAWISTRGWTKAWNWLLAGTRPANYSSTIALILLWADAWKWGRFWEHRTVRVVALSQCFCRLLGKMHNYPA